MTEKKVRPWDLFLERNNYVPAEVQSERLSICAACPELIKLTSQCKKCGCFMKQKTKLGDATCPLGKWKEYHKEGGIK